MRITILMFFTILTGCGMSPIEQTKKAMILPKEHFKTTATIKDDSLDTIAVIDTSRGFQIKKSLLNFWSDDNFLRAFIDKKSGEVTFQVYQSIYYRGTHWSNYELANYETFNAPESKVVTTINSDVHCDSLSSSNGCEYVENVGFDVDESLLRAIAKINPVGDPIAWKFKFIAKSGVDYQSFMLPTEVAGLLDAVDEYKSKSLGHLYEEIKKKNNENNNKKIPRNNHNPSLNVI